MMRSTTVAMPQPGQQARGAMSRAGRRGWRAQPTGTPAASLPLGQRADITIAVALLMAGWLAPSTSQAADVGGGEKIANERCAACHGRDGNTPIDPSYPKLAGQHADYLVVAMKAYRSERRKNAIMGAQAKPLSNADIENLAAYYAQLPSQLSLRR